MPRQTVGFEWIMGEEACEEALRHEVEPGIPLLSSRTRRLLIYLAHALFLLALPLVAAAGSAEPAAAYETRRHQSAIQASLDVEVEALLLQNRDLFDTTLDAAVADRWQQRWRSFLKDADRTGVHLVAGEVERIDDLLMADVWVTPPPRLRRWQPTAYLETRFYRERADGIWVRTMPPDAFWGEKHTLETEHLRFTYPERDAALVQAVAGEVEAAFVRTYQILDLDLSQPAVRPVTIEVLPHPVTDANFSFRHVYVPSPTFLWPKWANYPEEDQFKDELISQLVGYTLSWAYPTQRSFWKSFLHVGVTDWMASELSTRPHPWLIQADDVLAEAVADWWPLELEEMTKFRPFWYVADESDSLYWVRRQRAAYWLVNYTVDRYGQDQLPAFLDAIDRNRSWDRLIPALFEEPVETFSRRWNIYLMEQYESLVEP